MLVVLDATLVTSAFAVVLVLRFDADVPAHHWEMFWQFLPMGV